MHAHMLDCTGSTVQTNARQHRHTHRALCAFSISGGGLLAAVPVAMSPRADDDEGVLLPPGAARPGRFFVRARLAVVTLVAAMVVIAGIVQLPYRHARCACGRHLRPLLRPPPAIAPSLCLCTSCPRPQRELRGARHTLRCAV